MDVHCVTVGLFQYKRKGIWANSKCIDNDITTTTLSEEIRFKRGTRL